MTLKILCVLKTTLYMIKFFVIVYIVSTVRSHSYNIGRPQTFDQYDNLNRFSTYSFRILMSLSIGAHVSEETCCVAKKISTRQPLTKQLLPHAILLVVKRQMVSRLLPERSKSILLEYLRRPILRPLFEWTNLSCLLWFTD